jgi:hypothetical protein
MTVIKTAMGKTLDMDALRRQHEEIEAVGNVKMNSRGDRLDSQGDVKYTVQEVVREQATIPNQPRQAKMSDTVTPSKTGKKLKKTSHEVSRNPVFNDEGKTVSEEIEYSDGSMEVIDVLPDADIGE